MGRPKGSKNKPKEVTTSEVVTDVSQPATENTETEESSAPPAYLKRSQLLKEINDSNKERYASENDEPEETVDVSEPEEEQEETEETPTPEVEVKQEEPSPPKRKLVIDGVEKEFTEEQIIALAQKSGAVDSRLAEANRILEDAKRRAATPLGAQHADAIRRNDPTAYQPSSTPEDVEGELASQITRAIVAGEEGDVHKAVQTLLRSGRHSATQTEVKPEQIHGLVAETIAFERAKSLLETPPEQGGYADIWSDPMLRGMFKRREDELRDSQDMRPYGELYKAIGDEIRQWRDGLIKQHTPKTGLENRDDLKRTTGIVRGGGGKIPTMPLETKPKTHEEILSGMRRGRGLN